MKKLFIVAGELSGDAIGKWYKDNYIAQNTYCEGIGGNFLADSGMVIYKRLETLNLTGVTEIIKKLPFIFKTLSDTVSYIHTNNFTEVILIDFPGFNLRLAGKLKKQNPSIKITYVSPPQLWCWGAWRIKKLQKLCDDIVVMYPFEQAWYQQRGVAVRWLGSPVYDRIAPYLQENVVPQKKVALLPASRPQELVHLFPLCAEFIKQLTVRIPDVTFVLPLAESLHENMLEEQIAKNGLGEYRERIEIVQGAEEKTRVLSRCCAALTKPGTITLELALLGIPTLMFFKTSSLNYFLGKLVVRVDHMALPNLLAPRPLYPEFIQDKCKVSDMVAEAVRLIQSIGQKDGYYYTARKKLLSMRSLLKMPKQSNADPTLLK